MTVLSRIADSSSTWTHTRADEALFTLGYEKRTVEEYISLLLANEVALVIDVRKNPLSRKKGFSKKALSNSLSDVGIAYSHMPELGIDSSLRKNLKDRDDYDQLFLHYTSSILPDNVEALRNVQVLIGRFGRVALTCFELDPFCCHRQFVSEAFVGWIEITHL